MPRGINAYDEGRIQGRNNANSNVLNVVSPGIITDGLIFFVDPANFASFPAGGTVLYDLSNLRNNGTLTNGPTFSRDMLGSIVCDGTNDYIAFTDSGLLPTAGLTVSVWFSTTVADRWLIDKAAGGVLAGYKIVGTGPGPMQFAVNDKLVSTPTTVVSAGFLQLTGTWVPSTSLLMYRNGAQVGSNTTSIPASITDPASSLEIGRRATVTDYWNGSIGQVLIYNRALSPDEVQQNYNATRSRLNI